MCINTLVVIEHGRHVVLGELVRRVRDQHACETETVRSWSHKKTPGIQVFPTAPSPTTTHLTSVIILISCRLASLLCNVLGERNPMPANAQQHRQGMRKLGATNTWVEQRQGA